MIKDRKVLEAIGDVLGCRDRRVTLLANAQTHRCSFTIHTVKVVYDPELLNVEFIGSGLYQGKPADMAFIFSLTDALLLASVGKIEIPAEGRNDFCAKTYIMD